jgi:hypothetical protein
MAILQSADTSGISTDVTTLIGRLTAARAGYIDNISAGAVGLESTLATIDNLVDDLEGRLTASRAGYLDNLSAGAVAQQSTSNSISNYVDSLEGRLTAARAGYLDNISGGSIPTNNSPSVQRGTVHITSQYATVTISSVNTSKSVCIWGGFDHTHNQSEPRGVFPRLYLNSSTQVRAERDMSWHGHIYVPFQVAAYP